MTGASGNGKTVLITGASGFIGAHVVDSFLSHGYNVKATARSQQTAENIKKTHSKYHDQLSLTVVPDIAVPGAHDEAVKGVDGVIHVASPFVLQVEDNERDILIPAIKGTTSLLASVQEHNPNVKRVVITSSFAAYIELEKGSRPGYTYNEKDWNPATYKEAADPNTSGVVAYCASKGIAEKAAWEFVEKNKPNFSLTILGPTMVYGPGLQVPNINRLGTSEADIYRLMNGSEKTVPQTNFWGWVDVRDLAEAHLRGYESAKAAGQRYLTNAGRYTYEMVCDILRKDFPEKRDLVPEVKPGFIFPEVYQLDTSKIQNELGITFRDLQTSIHDMAVDLIEVEKRSMA